MRSTQRVPSVMRMIGRCVARCGRPGRVFPTLHAMWRGCMRFVSCRWMHAVTRRREVPGGHTRWRPRVAGKGPCPLQSFSGLLISLALLFTWAGVHAVVSPGERQGLVNLYIATNGPGWSYIEQGWHNHATVSVDPCDPPATRWTGVTCNGTTSITCVQLTL